MTDTSSGWRRALGPVVKLAVSTGLLALLLSRADLPALAARFRQMDPAWAAAALAAYGGMILVSAWRWRLLLRVQAAEVSTRALTESFLVATFFNNFLPSNIGGDVVRIADTAPYTGSKTLATTVVLMDRAIGLIALFFVAATGAMFAAREGLTLPGSGYLWVPPLLALAALVPALRAPAIVGRLAAPLRRLGGDWVEERLGRLMGGLERFGRRPAPLVWTGLGAFVVQGLLVVFYLCAARSLGIPLPWLTAALIIPISLAAQMLPLSINGFGVREAVFAFFFARLHLGLNPALALSLGSTGLIMLFSLSGGALFLLRQHRSQVGDRHGRYVG